MFLVNVCRNESNFFITNLGLNIDKCELGKSTIKFVGHIISAESISSDEKKKAVTRSPFPRKTKDVRAFLELTEYYVDLCRNMLQRLNRYQNYYEETLDADGIHNMNRHLMKLNRCSVMSCIFFTRLKQEHMYLIFMPQIVVLVRYCISMLRMVSTY